MCCRSAITACAPASRNTMRCRIYRRRTSCTKLPNRGSPIARSAPGTSGGVWGACRNPNEDSRFGHGCIKNPPEKHLVDLPAKAHVAVDQHHGNAVTVRADEFRAFIHVLGVER